MSPIDTMTSVLRLRWIKPLDTALSARRKERTVQDIVIVLRDKIHLTLASPQIHQSPHNHFHFIKSLAHSNNLN
jgi:hypothetical protein